jgi:acyl-CoA thioester hydrolase
VKDSRADYDPAEGRLDDRVAVTQHVVSLVHVDFVQVHFASYFGWVDLGFQALMALSGWSYSRCQVEGVPIPLVNVRCDYWRPLHLDTAFELHSYVSDTGRTSFTVHHQFVVGDTVVATAVAQHVNVRIDDDRPVAQPLPEWVLAARR